MLPIKIYRYYHKLIVVLWEKGLSVGMLFIAFYWGYYFYEYGFTFGFENFKLYVATFALVTMMLVWFYGGQRESCYMQIETDYENIKFSTYKHEVISTWGDVQKVIVQKYKNKYTSDMLTEEKNKYGYCIEVYTKNGDFTFVHDPGKANAYKNILDFSLSGILDELKDKAINAEFVSEELKKPVSLMVTMKKNIKR